MKFRNIREWGALTAAAGILQLGAFEALKLGGRDKPKENETQNQNESGLIQIEPAMSEDDFEDNVEAAIVDRNGKISEEKLKRIDLGMVMIDFLISSGKITMEEGDDLKKILETKRLKYRTMAKTNNQLEVLHGILQELKRYDPDISGLDNFLKTGEGDCEGAAVGIIALAQATYPELEMSLQQFSGKYDNHIRVIVKINYQWFSLEKPTPTPIIIDKGSTLMPVTDIIKAMAGRNIKSIKNGEAETPAVKVIDLEEILKNDTGADQVLKKIYSHDTGKKPDASFSDKKAVAQKAPSIPVDFSTAQNTLAKNNPNAGKLVREAIVALDLKRLETNKLPDEKARKITDVEMDRHSFKIRLVEKVESQRIKDDVSMELIRILINIEDPTERTRKISDFLESASEKYGVIYNELISDVNNRAFKNPEVQKVVNDLFQSEKTSSNFEELNRSTYQITLTPGTIAWIARHPELAFKQTGHQNEEERKIEMIRIFDAKNGTYPNEDQSKKIADLILSKCSDKVDIIIATLDKKSITFANNILSRLEKAGTVSILVHPEQKSLSLLSDLKLPNNINTLAIDGDLIEEPRENLRLVQIPINVLEKFASVDEIFIHENVKVEGKATKKIKDKITKTIFLNITDQETNQDPYIEQEKLRKINSAKDAGTLIIVPYSERISDSEKISEEALGNFLTTQNLPRDKITIDLDRIDFRSKNELSIIAKFSYKVGTLIIGNLDPGEYDLSPLKGHDFKFKFGYSEYGNDILYDLNEDTYILTKSKRAE